MSDRFTITVHGTCPRCGVAVTGSAIDAPDLGGRQLGDDFAGTCLCGADVPQRVVGLTLVPWIARLDDEDEPE